jgi:hypothetical protein
VLSALAIAECGSGRFVPVHREAQARRPRRTAQRSRPGPRPQNAASAPERPSGKADDGRLVRLVLADQLRAGATAVPRTPKAAAIQGLAVAGVGDQAASQQRRGR